MKPLTRRKFVKNGSIASAAILGVGFIPVGCAPYNYGIHFVEEDRIRIPKAEFGKKKFLLIQLAGLKAPVMIGRMEEGDYVAVLMECTHKQCTVALTEQSLECPCHGSEYTLRGKVIKSPAEKDLLTFNVSEDETNIYIY